MHSHFDIIPNEIIQQHLLPNLVNPRDLYRISAVSKRFLEIVLQVGFYKNLKDDTLATLKGENIGDFKSIVKLYEKILKSWPQHASFILLSQKLISLYRFSRMFSDNLIIENLSEDVVLNAIDYVMSYEKNNEKKSADYFFNLGRAWLKIEKSYITYEGLLHPRQLASRDFYKREYLLPLNQLLGKKIGRIKESAGLFTQGLLLKEKQGLLQKEKADIFFLRGNSYFLHGYHNFDYFNGAHISLDLECIILAVLDYFHILQLDPQYTGALQQISLILALADLTKEDLFQAIKTLPKKEDQLELLEDTFKEPKTPLGDFFTKKRGWHGNGTLKNMKNYLNDLKNGASHQHSFFYKNVVVKEDFSGCNRVKINKPHFK